MARFRLSLCESGLPRARKLGSASGTGRTRCSCRVFEPFLPGEILDRLRPELRRLRLEVELAQRGGARGQRPHVDVRQAGDDVEVQAP